MRCGCFDGWGITSTFTLTYPFPKDSAADE
jgi:hypothetical protein